MGHFRSNHCGKLGLVQETDLELLLCRFVDLDINFLAKFRNLYSFPVTYITLVIVFVSRAPCAVIDQPSNL